MARHDIPTARSHTFTDLTQAQTYVSEVGPCEPRFRLMLMTRIEVQVFALSLTFRLRLSGFRARRVGVRVPLPAYEGFYLTTAHPSPNSLCNPNPNRQKGERTGLLSTSSPPCSVG